MTIPEKYDMFELTGEELQQYYTTGLRFLTGVFGVAQPDVERFVDAVEAGDDEAIESDEYLILMNKLNRFLSSIGCASNGLATTIEMYEEGTTRINENHHQDHDASTTLIQTGVLLALGMGIMEGHLKVVTENEYE
jgi:hypothetical protein